MLKGEKVTLRAKCISPLSKNFPFLKGVLFKQLHY